MKNNGLAKSLISNIIAFCVSLIISFVLTPYLINNVGKEAYSFYPISNNFVSYMTIITMALNSMSSRFITIEISKNDIKKAKSYYSSVFFTNLILVMVLSIPMFFIIKYIDIFMDVPSNYIYEVKVMFILVFASMSVTVITSVFGTATFVKNRMDLNANKEIFQGIIKAILFIVLFAIFKPSIIYFGLVALVLSITNFIIQYSITKKILPEIKISFKDFDLKKVKELLGSGIWNSINSLGAILLINISLLLANLFIGAKASGDLSIVQTLPNFMTTIICAIYSVFLPRITQIYASNNKGRLINEVKKSQVILGLISTVPAILVILFGKEFFYLWVPNENADYLQVLSIITILPLLVHGNMWTIYGLTVTQNKMKVPSFILIIIGIINVSISYILLKYTNMGLIVIPLVSSILNIIYYLLFIPIYASKNSNINILTFYPHLIRTGLFSGFAIIIGSYFKNFIIITTWIEFFFWGGLFGIIGLLINCIFVLNKKSLKKKYINLNIIKNKSIGNRR